MIERKRARIKISNLKTVMKKRRIYKQSVKSLVFCKLMAEATEDEKLVNFVRISVLSVENMETKRVVIALAKMRHQ